MGRGQADCIGSGVGLKKEGDRRRCAASVRRGRSWPRIALLYLITSVVLVPVLGVSVTGVGVDARTELGDGLADQAGPPGEELDLVGVQAALADVEADVGDGEAEDVDAHQQADDQPDDVEAVGDRLPDGDDEDDVQQVAEVLRDVLAEQGVVPGVAGCGLGVGVVEVLLEPPDLHDAERGVDRAQEDHAQLAEREAVLGDLAGVVLPAHGGDVQPDRGRDGRGDDVEDQVRPTEERHQAEQSEAGGQQGRETFTEVDLRGGGRRRGLRLGCRALSGDVTVRVVAGGCHD